MCIFFCYVKITFELPFAVRIRMNMVGNEKKKKGDRKHYSAEPLNPFSCFHLHVFVSFSFNVHVSVFAFSVYRLYSRLSSQVWVTCKHIAHSRLADYLVAIAIRKLIQVRVFGLDKQLKSIYRNRICANGQIITDLINLFLIMIALEMTFDTFKVSRFSRRIDPSPWCHS